MKKIIAVILATFVILCTFASCKKKNDEGPTFYATESPSFYSKNSSEMTQNGVSVSNSTSAPTEVETTLKTPPESNGIVTYISENYDNKYICLVAEKYGSNKGCLIAFIKRDGSLPKGATVLEFSGATNSEGNIIFSAEELRYVYEVYENGTINCASKNGDRDVGYNKFVAGLYYSLGEKYLLPSIGEMRVGRRYEDYFAD